MIKIQVDSGYQGIAEMYKNVEILKKTKIIPRTIENNKIDKFLQVEYL